MVAIRYTGDELWERIERAVEKVKQRLRRVASALDAASIPYAVVGDNAVQIWVAQVDESAVRNTRDVDIVLNRSDLEGAKTALAGVGFHYRHVKGVDMFLDGRDAVHVVFAGEKVRPEHAEPVPRIEQCERVKNACTLSLESLVRMKLTSFRDKDRMHLRDMLDVELIDASWLPRFSPELQNRLQALIDDPDG